MSIVGKVASLWRYPVKSMRGEELDEAFIGVPGVYGDRLFAFTSATRPKDFPYFTARQQQEMLLYHPHFRYPDKAAKPLNLTDADHLAVRAQPFDTNREAMMLDVETPSGERLAIDDPLLIQRLTEGLSEEHDLQLLRSDHALADCYPVSLISLQTVRQLEAETGSPVDPRCFRANIYLDFSTAGGFAEDDFVGKSLHIGANVVLSVIKRDGRCKMITLDPDTGVSDPALLRQVAQEHEGKAGVYCTVLVEGIVRKGDTVSLASS